MVQIQTQSETQLKIDDTPTHCDTKDESLTAKFQPSKEEGLHQNTSRSSNSSFQNKVCLSKIEEESSS